MSPETLLIISHNPPGQHALGVDAIVRKIRNVCDERLGDIEHHPDLHLSDLEAQLRAHRPRIVQFIGHGVADGRLVMKRQDERPGDVAPEAVVAVLKAAPRMPELFLATACLTSALGAALAQAGVSAVISLRERVPDASLEAFSAAFYRRLAEGGTVREAFDSGRAAVAGETEGKEDLFQLDEHAPGLASTLRLASPARPTRIPPEREQQIIVWLDLDQEQPTREEIEHLLPPQRRGERVWLTLSDYNGPRLDRDRVMRDLPWGWLSKTIAALGRELRGRLKADREPQRYFVVGRAPLPAFVQLGNEMSGWSAPVTLLNKRKTAQGEVDWDVIALDEPGGSAPFFDRIDGLQGRNLAQGRLNLYVSCTGDEAPPGVERFVAPDGSVRAGTVTLSTTRASFVTRHNGPTIAAQLVSALTDVNTVWPEHGPIGVFVRGPTTLAFMVGRALNPRMHPAFIPDFVHPDYLPAISLPLDAREPQPVDYDEPRGQLERLQVLHRLRDAFQAGRRRLKPEHLRPPAHLLRHGEDPARVSERLERQLGELSFQDEPGAEAFEFSIFQRRISVGPGFLEALRGLSRSTLDQLGPLFVLHELLHLRQRLTGRTYRGVGRAGFALEEVDFWADTFALSAWTRGRLAREGLDAEERCGEILCSAIDAHGQALMAFDRMEHGERIDELPERRLRRYLIWALQHARAATARTPEHVQRILGERVILEIAPLRGTLNSQYDKVVDGVSDHTELFITLGGRLTRLPSAPGRLELARLIERVRTYQWAELCTAMAAVVESAHEELAPWVDEG